MAITTPCPLPFNGAVLVNISVLFVYVLIKTSNTKNKSYLKKN